jgi:hypothetical protein
MQLDCYCSIRRCKACSAGNKAYKILVICAFALALVIIVALLLRGQTLDEDDHEVVSTEPSCFSQTVTWLRDKSSTIMVRFKILVTHFQIIAGLPLLLSASFPESFTSLTDTLAIFNLDVWALLSRYNSIITVFARRCILACMSTCLIMHD